MDLSHVAAGPVTRRTLGEEPAYLERYRQGSLVERAAQAIARLERCDLCPRRCAVDRTRGELGTCRTGRRALLASFHPHFGEEAPLVGHCGSGTIFFASCNLLCSFCQNFEISHVAPREQPTLSAMLGRGYEVTQERLAAVMLQLADAGCHNINLVSPSHVVPQILEALPVAIEGGLRVPLVYNTGGYDTVETLALLDGVVDIYMPDLKFWDGVWAERYCDAVDYPEVARAALREMHRQVGELVLDGNGIAQRGMLVRHLVMPGGVSGTPEVMRFLAEELSPDTYVNVMDQYRPCGRAPGDPHVGRAISAEEHRDALRAAAAAGLRRLDDRTGRF